MARELIATSSSIGPEDRLDLVIHAASQLPSSVTVRICGEGPLRDQLEALATAYGIQSRVRFESGLSGALVGTWVYPSAHNAATALVQPDAANGRSLIVDGEPEGAVLGGGARLGIHHNGTVVGTMAVLLGELSAADDPPAPTCAREEHLRGHRIAIVTNYPTHYRVPLFNAIASRLSDVGCAMRVFFTDADREQRPWMRPGSAVFEHESVQSRRIPWTGITVPLGLRARLQAYRPSLLLVGGFSPLAAGQAMALAVQNATPVGIWSGEIPSRRTARGRLRRVQRTRLMRRATFGIAYGYRGREYLRRLAPSLPCVYGRNTTPLPSAGTRPSADQRVEILTVSRAVPGKGLEVLIDAVRMLKGVALRLTLAGDGPLLSELRSRAAGDDRIRILGAVRSDRVGDLYDRANIFAFPSQFDVFGLVLVEAFAAGLAVVTSSAPGATSDLAVPGRNCLLTDAHTPHAWALSLRSLVEDAALRRKLGEAASATVQKRWTMDHAADAMIAGLRLGVICHERKGMQADG